jgi:hypothetical protein
VPDVTPARIPAQVPAPPDREFLGRRPDYQRHGGHGYAHAVPCSARRSLWENAQLALLAFTHQVLLRPARIGTLVALGGMIALVALRGDGWWIVLGVVLFQAAAAAFTAVWVDFDSAARSRRRAAWLPMPIDWLRSYLPQQRRPGPDQ